jgi:hypothetical protein
MERGYWILDTGCWMLDDGGGGERGSGCVMGQSRIANSRERFRAGRGGSWKCGIERPGDKLLVVTELDPDTWVGSRLVAGVAAQKGSPFPLSSAAEERGIKFSGWLPRVADA